MSSITSKETWGNVVWYLFHSLAEKIDENKFNNNKNIIITTTKLICSCLPCPDCSKDATNILNKINLNAIINSKNELIKFYYDFHNNINSKLKKPQFKYNDLNKYKNANFNLIYNNFIVIFSHQPAIPKLMMENFHRNNNLKIIIKNINLIKNDFI
tara:strand:+ start:2680 stop:3147 length:468 start_codon:yes stop_codon:yes gene_type:complete